MEKQCHSNITMLGCCCVSAYELALYRYKRLPILFCVLKAKMFKNGFLYIWEYASLGKYKWIAWGIALCGYLDWVQFYDAQRSGWGHPIC